MKIPRSVVDVAKTASVLQKKTTSKTDRGIFIPQIVLHKFRIPKICMIEHNNNVVFISMTCRTCQLVNTMKRQYVHPSPYPVMSLQTSLGYKNTPVRPAKVNIQLIIGIEFKLNLKILLSADKQFSNSNHNRYHIHLNLNN